MSDDFDNPWKEALDTAFEPFAEFLFPEAHAGIDWSRGYELLDKELRQAIPQAEVGPRVVDFLAKVWRTTGEEEWVLVHVEVQSQPAAAFAERMFVYHCRLYELYRRPIASLAVLADDRPGWRPADFGYDLWGCELKYRFPMVKLLDLATDRARLEASDNPFASVVLAHLETMATVDSDERRRDSKLAIVRRLYNRGWSAERVRLLFKVIDWMMKLSERLDDEFWDRVLVIEQEQKMPYLMSFERKAQAAGLKQGLGQGLERGLKRGIASLLKVRFAGEAAALIREIDEIHDADMLGKILDLSETAASAADLRELWAPHE